MRSIEMPPDAAALMESTRAIGYSLPTAVADIIDNSIAAGATRVEIFYLPTEQYVALLDDGCGMSGAELNVAMKYGGRSPLDARAAGDLGRFGLGMKTASLSQCEVLTVASKQNDRLAARRWDLNHVRRQNSWALLELDASESDQIPEIDRLKTLAHGTLVVWQSLDRMLRGGKAQNQMTEEMNAVRRHLALVFHRYLLGEDGLKRISISMNNNPIEPSDPFLTHRSTQITQKYSLAADGSRITIVPYMLPHPSKLKSADRELLGLTVDLQKNQGFYVYRNKRLIVWGTWFNRSRKDALSQLARIRIDIPTEFDNLWVLDVKKSSASPPSFIRQKLDAVIENVAKQSRRTWEYRGRRESDDKIEHIWNRLKTREGNILYEINESHPMVQRTLARPRNLKRLLELIAASLPLNQLTIDLNGSKNEIGNAEMISEEKVRAMLEIMLDGATGERMRNVLESLKRVEPFNAFTNLLDGYDSNGEA